MEANRSLYYTDTIAPREWDDLDEALAQEERLIELYQAELAVLNQNTNENHDTESHLPSTVAVTQCPPMLEELMARPFPATDRTFETPVAAALSQFRFTSVEQKPSTGSLETDDALEYDYVLRGHFVLDPSVEAVLRLRLSSLGGANSPKHTPTTTGTFAMHMTHVECRLLASAAKIPNLPEVQQQLDRQAGEMTAASGGDWSHYIPVWITGMTEYLEFLQARCAIGSSFGQASCVCLKTCTVVHAGPRSFVDIPIYKLRPPRSRNSDNHRSELSKDPTATPLTKPSHILSLVCSWRWNDRKASLRLHQEKWTSPASVLRQSDLDQLVVACNNDCWQALELLLTHCSGCTCWKEEAELETRNSPWPDRPSHLQDPLDDADDEGDDEEEEEDEEETMEQYVRVRKRRPTFLNDLVDDLSLLNEEAPLDQAGIAPTSPYRLSPSGRRRSDYEVQRLLRIERNESKLSQLGLLRPNSASVNKFQTLKRRPKRRRLSLPTLSGSRQVYGPMVQPRLYPQRPNDRTSLRPPIARPKMPRRPSQITEDAMDTPPIGFVETENGCLMPKIPPCRMEDGFRFKRPRGAAPAGYHWDPLVGLWAPLRDNAPVVESPSTQPPTFRGFVVTEDNCLLPKKGVERDMDGTSYKRPRGAAPSGFDWNPIRGVWEPIHFAFQSPLQESAPSSVSDRLEIDLESDLGVATKIPFVTDSSDSVLEQRTWNGYYVTSYGCLFPKNDVERDIDGGFFKRPYGEAPAGFSWDPMRGLWEPVRALIENQSVPVRPAWEAAREPSESETETLVAPSTNAETDNDGNLPNENTFSASFADDDHVTTEEVLWKGFKVTSDGCLFPKQAPKRDKNGSSFKRPQGKAPAGYSWDPMQALWKPIRALTDYETPLEASRGPLENEAQMHICLRTNVEPGLDENILVENDKNCTVAADEFVRSEEAMWKGFKVTSDGCLFPKQTPKRDKDGSSFIRPKGKAPAGYSWDPIRGLWEPFRDSAIPIRVPCETTREATENNAEITVAHCQSFTFGADLGGNLLIENGKNSTAAADDDGTIEEVMWKGFKVTSDGCLFPKQTPKRVKDGSSFKRPQGKAPAGYRWDPIRGLWEPFVPTREPTENETELSVARTFNVVEPYLDRNSLWENSRDALESESGTWKGFKVSSDGSLFPKQMPKREKDGVSFKRPKGKAPAGYHWHPSRGVWDPIANYKNKIAEKSDRTLRQKVMDDLMGGETWKGFGVTAEGCLLPKKEPKREVHYNVTLFKRPHGAAPRGFRWNPELGLWDCAVQSERTSAPLSASNEVAVTNSDEADSSTVLNPPSNKRIAELDTLNEHLVASDSISLELPNEPPKGTTVAAAAAAVLQTPWKMALAAIFGPEITVDCERAEPHGRSYPKRSQKAMTVQRYAPPVKN